VSKILPLITAPAAFAAIARKVNELVAVVKPLKAGAGIKIVETPENTLIAANTAAIDERLNALEAEILFPAWKIIPVLGSAKVTIYPSDVTDGFTGGLVPTIGGTPINSASPPELSVSTGSIYLKATIDEETGEITALIIENAASLPADSGASRYRRIGTVNVSGTVVTVTMQSINQPLSHLLCGGLSIWGTSG
jgi:hypothetical protein